MDVKDKSTGYLTKNLSPAAVLSFSIGTSIGWGSLVVTNNAYLGQAGPLGSVIGMVIGAVIMLVISRSYAYLMRAYPEAGGAYSYVRETFGHDHGFLASWFLALSFLAILWANATSLPLFAHYFIGDTFRFGRLYEIFGYEVYLGEVLMTVAAILFFAFLCSKFKRLVAGMMVGMAILFTLGIIACFVAAMVRRDSPMSPGFVPDSNAVSQIVKIACISPWAFIGFESISHSTEEFSFGSGKIFRIFVISVITTTVLYICVMLLSVTAYPPEYGSWLEYIKDLSNLDGIKALPAFYAADHYLGGAGVAILMLTLLSLVFTSFIGNITALSRLFYALAKDEIIPARFCRINRYGIPGRAVMLVAAFSVLIPLLGRTAIGWIVDVTTLGATLVYGFVSAAAARLAGDCRDRSERITGLIGIAACIGFGMYILIPNLFGFGMMETESFFLFVVWAVLGFIYFRFILRHDTHKRFGRSIIVWIALLSLVLFVSMVWMNRSILDATDRGMGNVEDFYTAAGIAEADASVVTEQMDMIRAVSTRSIVVVVVLFAIALGILLNNYRTMSKKAMYHELQHGQVRDLAFTDPLTGVRSKLAYAEVEREINEAISKGEQPVFSVAVCDVNGLKQINDTLGHKAGDEYICEAAVFICKMFSGSTVFRTGGDEFVVLISGEDHERRAEIMKAFHDRSVENIGKGEVVISAGLAEYVPGSASDLHEIFVKADALMYEEKKLLKSKGAATRL